MSWRFCGISRGCNRSKSRLWSSKFFSPMRARSPRAGDGWFDGTPSKDQHKFCFSERIKSRERKIGALVPRRRLIFPILARRGGWSVRPGGWDDTSGASRLSPARSPLSLRFLVCRTSPGLMTARPMKAAYPLRTARSGILDTPVQLDDCLANPVRRRRWTSGGGCEISALDSTRRRFATMKSTETKAWHWNHTSLERLAKSLEVATPGRALVAGTRGPSPVEPAQASAASEPNPNCAAKNAR
jgi:hypothetical protein